MSLFSEVKKALGIERRRKRGKNGSSSKKRRRMPPRRADGSFKKR
jgi:hypothetical protein